MTLQLKKAVKYGSKLRLALYGPSGSGKTYTALSIGAAMAGDKRVAVIDTERGSASKYADLFDFDVIELDNFHPNTFVEAIREVVKTGQHGVLIIDTISHEWEGKGGALELAGRDFTNWSRITPLHNAFVDEMLRAPLHVIATLRAKEEYAMEKEEGKSKTSVRKLGMEPIQRKGIQYEFDITGSLDGENTLTIEKTRCSALQGAVFQRASEDFAQIVQTWLDGDLPPARLISKDKLNELYNRSVKAKCVTSLDEFTDFIKDELDLDVAIEPRRLTEEQGRDLEAAVFNRERHSQAPSRQPESAASTSITEQQIASIRKLSEHLGKAVPTDVTSFTFIQAKSTIQQLTAEYRESRNGKSA
jgi:hypothetical protein